MVADQLPLGLDSFSTTTSPLTLLFLIVTFCASTTTSQLNRFPSMTVALAVMKQAPDETGPAQGVRVPPAGTPVFVASGQVAAGGWVVVDAGVVVAGAVVDAAVVVVDA